MGKGTTDQTTSTSRALAAEGHARLRNGPLGNLIEWAQHRTSAAGSRVYCGTMRHDCKSCLSQAAIGPKGKKCRTRMSDPTQDRPNDCIGRAIGRKIPLLRSFVAQGRD